jgi:hypothetical protein
MTTCSGIHPGREAKIGPYDLSQCFLCWRNLNRGRPGTGAASPPAPLVRRPLPCVHLGAATGRQVECGPCTGRARLKVHSCAVHGECTLTPGGGLPSCPCERYEPNTYSLVAPLGTAGRPLAWEGRQAKRPWQWRVSCAIPHLDTLEPLKVVLDLLRLQTEPPYLLVIDTGSPPAVCAELERLRADDLEVHFVRGHGYRNSSGAITAAMDLAFTLCRSEYLYATHSDVFARRRDFLSWLLARCSASCPVVGYEMSPRDWATDQWRGVPSHTATLYHMPTMRRHGLMWSMELGYDLAGWQGRPANGWPDTETALGLRLKAEGLRVDFIGHEQNYVRHLDENIDHPRSYTGSKVYHPGSAWHKKTSAWMEDALRQARERVLLWSAGVAG